MEFKWEMCESCGPFVRCPKCGNNCCNGTYGGEPGAWCVVCPLAYDVQDLGPPEEFMQTKEYVAWKEFEEAERNDRIARLKSR